MLSPCRGGDDETSNLASGVLRDAILANTASLMRVVQRNSQEMSWYHAYAEGSKVVQLAQSGALLNECSIIPKSSKPLDLVTLLDLPFEDVCSQDKHIAFRG